MLLWYITYCTVIILRWIRHYKHVSHTDETNCPDFYFNGEKKRSLSVCYFCRNSSGWKRGSTRRTRRSPAVCLIYSFMTILGVSLLLSSVFMDLHVIRPGGRSWSPVTVLDRKSEVHQHCYGIHPQGTKNVCATFHHLVRHLCM